MLGYNLFFNINVTTQAGRAHVKYYYIIISMLGYNLFFNINITTQAARARASFVYGAARARRHGQAGARRSWATESLEALLGH